MTGQVVLDVQALRDSVIGSPTIERCLLLLFVETADKCLTRMRGLVAHGSRREWQSIAVEFMIASAVIHATELAAVCKRAVDAADDAVSRMSAYLQLKDAYDAFVRCLRDNELLKH